MTGVQTCALPIYQKTAGEICKIFSAYNPDWEESDFYESDIGSAGMMRAYMLHKCDKYFTLKKKIEKYLNMSLRCYNVPLDVIAQTIAVVKSLDIVKMAKNGMEELFSALEMTFGFKFENKEN